MGIRSITPRSEAVRVTLDLFVVAQDTNVVGQQSHDAQIDISERRVTSEATLYRSMGMKLSYAAQDGVDLSEAVKRLTRHMQEPWIRHSGTQDAGSVLVEKLEVRVERLSVDASLHLDLD